MVFHITIGRPPIGAVDTRLRYTDGPEPEEPRRRELRGRPGGRGQRRGLPSRVGLRLAEVGLPLRRELHQRAVSGGMVACL